MAGYARFRVASQDRVIEQAVQIKTGDVVAQVTRNCNIARTRMRSRLTHRDAVTIMASTLATLRLDNTKVGMIGKGR